MYSLARCALLQQQPNWSELPNCVLSYIMDKLIVIDDYVRFGAVCVSWRTVFLQESLVNKKKHCALLPFLLIPPLRSKEEEEEEEDDDDGFDDYDMSMSMRMEIRKPRKEKLCLMRGLYSVAKGKVYDFQLNLPNNKYCRGSSFGWLITIQIIPEYGDKYIVQLQNPFLLSSDIIDLPTIDNIRRNDRGPFLYIHKAVLSSDPLFTPNNFVLMAIMGCFGKLAFYKHGSTKTWKTIQWENKEWFNFDDLIYFRASQQFYAVLNQTGAVIAIDFNTRRRMRGQSGITPKLTQIAPPTPQVPGQKRYLVETSSGQLLQVIKNTIYKRIDDWGTVVPITNQFEVFKFDPIATDWTQLHDIGDTSLFLGDNSSLSCSVSDFPGCKPNSIYYLDDSNVDHAGGWQYMKEDTGIYNLEDGTTQQHYPTASRIIFPTPIWLEPTLQR